MWEEWLAMEALWYGLGLRDALPIGEQAQGVRVCRFGVQVQHHRDNLVLGQSPLRACGPVLPHAEGTIGIEEDVVLALTKDKRRVSCGEAEADGLLRGRATATGGPVARVTHWVCLEDLHLEHVSASLHAHIRAGSRDQILHTTIRERSEEPASQRRDDVESAVQWVEANGLLEHRSLVRRRILLFLNSLLHLGLLFRRLRDLRLFLILSLALGGSGIIRLCLLCLLIGLLGCGFLLGWHSSLLARSRACCRGN
mmetsp:Transcript_146036/g.364158  ORF Transcript_146036/g.364158 Transcript_146036/m.364158 type:complete len:254 (+) Transcript_146036:1744-2505(+)